MAVTGGASLYMVGKVLGHKDSRTTEIYAHIGADPLKVVANHVATAISKLIEPSPKAKPQNQPILTQAAE